MVPSFQEFIDHSKIALSRRANRRAREQWQGFAEDDMGRYWLARTKALERVAAAARYVTAPHRSVQELMDGMRAVDEMLKQLDEIPVPPYDSFPMTGSDTSKP